MSSGSICPKQPLELCSLMTIFGGIICPVIFGFSIGFPRGINCCLWNGGLVAPWLRGCWTLGWFAGALLSFGSFEGSNERKPPPLSGRGPISCWLNCLNGWENMDKDSQVFFELEPNWPIKSPLNLNSILARNDLVSSFKRKHEIKPRHEPIQWTLKHQGFLKLRESNSILFLLLSFPAEII